MPVRRAPSMAGGGPFSGGRFHAMVLPMETGPATAEPELVEPERGDDTPRLTAPERAALIGDLEAASARVAAGEFVVFDVEDQYRRFLAVGAGRAR